MRRAILLLVLCAVLSKIAFSQVLTTLVSFNGTNGGGPFSSLVLGSDGNFYGTTTYGGNSQGLGFGTVFKVTPQGALTSLYSFQGDIDGYSPNAPLVQASDGNFYGTTIYGGAHNDGTIFRITPQGSLTTIHNFALGDGYQPYAGLLQGTDGELYGTTVFGGSYNAGTIFKTTLGGMLTSIHGFLTSDGGMPYAGLLQASDGNFYGTTRSGGSSGDGTVFRVTSQGPLTTLHSFNNADGEYPYAGLVQATDGNFYGATYYGGAYACGVVFKITPQGILTLLHEFNCTDGWYANNLIQGRDGNLYGTTIFGGNTQLCGAGCGTIYQITLQGKLTTIYRFNGVDGQGPSGLTEINDGEFYGTTGGGTSNDGTVFRLVAHAALSVAKSGLGTVISGDGRISCGAVCSYVYLGGARTGLTAISAPGYTFSGWSGCDSVQGSICSLAMSSARNVTATFSPAQVALTSLVFSPPAVKSGQFSVGTLTLAQPAPAGGLGIGITSTNPQARASAFTRRRPCRPNLV